MFDYDLQYEEIPEHLFMAQEFKEMFDDTARKMQHPAYKGKKDNIKPVDMISAIVNGKTPTSGYACADRIKRCIMGMYGSFEKIVKNKYPDDSIFQYTPEMIETVYATCIASVQNSISNEAVLEVNNILESVKNAGLKIPGLELKIGGEEK